MNSKAGEKSLYSQGLGRGN